MTGLERVRLVFAIGGLAILVAGVALESRLVVWGAIVFLGIAFLLRLYLKKKGFPAGDSGQDLG